MPDVTFCDPDLDSFCGLDRLGLTVTGQQVGDDHTVLSCRVVEPDQWCRRCGVLGQWHDTVARDLAHVPLGWRPTILRLRVRRWRCTGCGGVWRQDTGLAAVPRGKLSRPAVLWALKSLVIDRLSISRIAAMLAVSWHTVNDAVLAAGRALLINDPARLDGVRVLGVDEHAWRHTRRGDRYVTVIIDLTPVRDGTGPSRLLDIVPGRSKQVFTTWLQAQTATFRDGIQTVAMDGFTGFKTATTDQLPDAAAVMDPFHVVALAGEAVDRCRQRIQQQTCGHRGRAGDPLYRARRVLRTGTDLLTERQQHRLAAVFAADGHAEVEATWGVYQGIVAAYRNPDRTAAKTAMTAVIASISRGVPAALTELKTLGRTLTRRAADVLAYFDLPGTSNGPTEAINGRLEHLRGTALGFRNLTNYITRALLDTGGFRPHIHPLLR
ncbi:MAG: ISL3 family transposase [Euzebyales bacterium]|nr:ISL3 family transposase [Euzebyales bacterium]